MKRFDHINVIPFIDIMLVLLAIVLTTATFISQGQLSIDVPKSSNNNSIEQSPIQIAIGADHQLFYQKKVISLEDLDKQLAKLSILQNIEVNIDQNVPFQQFITLLDLIKKYDFKKLLITTQHI